jgi:hypothetical protein
VGGGGGVLGEWGWVGGGGSVDGWVAGGSTNEATDMGGGGDPDQKHLKMANASSKS